MMTPEQLRAARESYAVVLRGIIRDIEKIPNSAFFLMEGKDGDYYRPRIDSIMAGSQFSVQIRNCRGKKNLKPLLAAVLNNKSTNNSRILFFFDKDYENDIVEITHPQCFVTEGYSIENYYTTKDAFNNIVSSFVFSDLTSSDDEQIEVANVNSLFQNVQNAFHQHIKLFNLWAWCQRHFPRTGSLNLDDFVVADVFKIDVDLKPVTVAYDLIKLNELSPERDPIRQDEIDIAEAWFSTRTLQMAYRGKQERDFLYYFLVRVSEKSSKGSAPFLVKRKVRKRISRNELTGDLSTVAVTSAMLVNFVRCHLAIWNSAPAEV